jgi:hypothetical protein
MARYYVDNRFNTASQQNLATTLKTLVSVYSNTGVLRRGRCVAVAVGPDGAPNATDCQIVYTVERMTANGTATAATPNPRFPADQASNMLASVNYTAEGTYTLLQWTRSLNQRASMQWAAQDYDAMILWPATNLNGLILGALSPTYAANAFGGLEYEDL